MKTRSYKYLVGDFETTVYEGQEDTEVWASAVVEMNTEDVHIFHSIGDTFDYLVSLNTNIVIYYHNLKFDGTFWLYFLMCSLNMKQACNIKSEEPLFVEWLNINDMKNNTFKYMISDMGQWYSIVIRYNNKTIEIRDSLKLLPFSVAKIGKDFNTKHKKLDMEYKGFRYAGCTITDEEKKYIANDVLVIKEALEIMFQERHNKLTIGACCMSEFKYIMGKERYEDMFPDLTEFKIPEDTYGSSNADEYIRKSYKGGWCYLAKGKENKIYTNGTTADVNSLYPSMMSSESGNRYPIGSPIFWKGNFIPENAKRKDRYFFVRIRTRFYLKPNYLPCIQIKGSHLYRPTLWLETSDLWCEKTGEYYTEYTTPDGAKLPAVVTLTLTQTDFELIKKHYDLIDFEILDGCYFDSEIGIFDEYINKYKKIKLESKGAIRAIAKLFLNNLYGKFASSKNSSFKYAYVDKNGAIGYVQILEFNKKVGYIPIGSAITSYARNFTITAAQKNYHGVNHPGFIYADTDSIHCDLSADELVGVPYDEKDFCKWAYESTWDKAIFVRQKTYIEHIVQKDLEDVERPYYDVKCAGMPESSKKLFIYSMDRNNPDYEEEISELSQEHLDFINQPRTLKDFTVGLNVPGKLMPKRIRGGTLLVETTYEMR